MANKIESTSCLYLDTLWEEAMLNGDMLATLPITAIKLLRSVVTRTIYNMNSMAISLLSMRKNLDSFFAELDFDAGTKENLCEMVFRCKASLEYLIPSDPSKETVMTRMLIPDSNVRNTIREYVYNDGPVDKAFDLFNDFYCRLSMSYAAESLLTDLALGLLAELYELERKIKPIMDALDSAVDRYMEAIAPFLEFMDGLDKFGDCVMSVCDYATTSKNYKADRSNKYSIQKSDGTWVFVTTEWLEEAYKKQTEMYNDIISAENTLKKWISSHCDPSINEKASNITTNTGSYGKSYI